MNGIDLKVIRIRARVDAIDLARVVGVTRQRVSQIEAAPRVSPTWIDRYLDGVAVLASASHDRNAGEGIDVA